MTYPRVRIPDELGGGFAYKRAVVDEFNSGVDSKLDTSRLTRIKLCSRQINELELLLQRRLDKQKVVTAADKSSSGGLPQAPQHRHQPLIVAPMVRNMTAATTKRQIFTCLLVQTSHLPWFWTLGKVQFTHVGPVESRSSSKANRVVASGIFCYLGVYQQQTCLLCASGTRQIRERHTGSSTFARILT